MLIFAYPWLLLLAPLPLLVRYAIAPRKRTRAAVRVPFLSRLVAAGDDAAGHQVRRQIAPILLSGCVWVALLASLARPQWMEDPIERTIPTRDLLVLVDLSSSMDHKDFTDAAGQASDRLESVKEVLGDFLVQRQGDRVGLVVFGNAPFLQVPFTTDLELCRQLLDEARVGMAGPRTALGDAIGLGIQLFDQSDAPTKTIIALTDGNDTASSVPPVEASRVARDRQITIHTIAIGDPETVGEEELDTASLQEVAAATGGDYFLALDREQLAGVYQRLDEIETRDAKTVSHRPRRDVYYWPLVAALVLWMLPPVWSGLRSRRVSQTMVHSSRLRVDSRTFEMKAVEE